MGAPVKKGSEGHTPAAPHPGHGEHGHGEKGAKGKGKEAPSFTGCLSGGCRTTVARFGFCDEHYEQFKFGLIKKTGEPVSDYEKKFEHYRLFCERTRKSGTHKVA